MVDADMAAAGLRTFFRIAKRWKLTDDEQTALLGLQDESFLVALRSGTSPDISRDMLERISYVLGIFKAINTLLPVPERADGWLRSANSSPIFGGAPPIARMASGNVSDLYVVRQHLECQLI
jgi:hypothetical protein